MFMYQYFAFKSKKDQASNTFYFAMYFGIDI